MKRCEYYDILYTYWIYCRFVENLKEIHCIKIVVNWFDYYIAYQKIWKNIYTILVPWAV